VNSVFLRRPRPDIGESLTGYIIRLAIANRCDVYNIKNALLTRAWHKGMDNCHSWDFYGQEIIDYSKLAKWTRLHRSDLERMTFFPIWRKFGIHPVSSHSSSMFVSKCIVKSLRRFCPLCVKQNGVFQLLWQVEELQVCLIHNVRLQESCGECGAIQPYMSNKLKAFVCVNGCTELLTSCPDYVSDPAFIEDQIRKYHDWQMLLDETTVVTPQIQGLADHQSLIAVLLYIGQVDKNSYKSDERVVEYEFVEYFRGTKDSAGGELVVPLRRILDIVRRAGISLCDLPNIHVPKQFINSILIRPEDTYVCQVPWCKLQGTNAEIMRIVRKYDKKVAGRKFNLRSICGSCGIEHGIDELDGVWKTIGNEVQMLLNVRQMLHAGYSGRQIIQHTGLHWDRVNILVGYLSYHELLPEHLVQRYKPKNIERQNLVSKFREIAEDAEQAGVYRIHWYKASGWSHRDYSYYFASPEVKKFIVFELKYNYKNVPKKERLPRPHVRERIEAAIEELLLKEEDISQKSVEKIVGLPDGSVWRNGYSALVKDGARTQAKIRRDRYVEQLVALAVRYIIQCLDQTKTIRKRDAYVAIGVNPHGASQRYPNVSILLDTAIQGQSSTIIGFGPRNSIVQLFPIYEEASVTTERDFL
jgi:hypothetical protein